MQLTYNTQNLVGSGCWESRDGGLSDFGRDVIDEMNRAGVLVDLSHVGAKTTEDAIRHSAKPVAFTHCCPIAFLDHPRNKTDAEMRLIAERGGFVGVATYTPFLPWHDETTVEQCVEVFEHVIDVAGEDNVGLGTDFTEGQDVAFFEWLGRDKGVGRNLMAGTKRVPPGPKGLETLADYPNLTDAMLRKRLEPAPGREDHGRKLAPPLPRGLGRELSGRPQACQRGAAGRQKESTRRKRMRRELGTAARRPADASRWRAVGGEPGQAGSDSNVPRPRQPTQIDSERRIIPSSRFMDDGTNACRPN